MAYLAFEPEDRAVAEAIGVELERQGWAVNRAGPDLRAEENGAALTEAIAGAPAVVAVLSARSGHSEALRRELSAAVSNGRVIVPVLASDVGSENWLHETLDLDQAIDARAGFGREQIGALTEYVRAGLGPGRVIAMLNIKGGVGKTVLAANLFAAAHLIDKRRISFIDLDPQHNLTQYFLSPAERNRIRADKRTIYSALEGSTERSTEDMLVPLNRSRRGPRAFFDLVAGDEQLFEYTLDTRPEADKARAMRRFRKLVANLRARSDAVIIDANPCATFLTRLAIGAADHIVAPVRPEQYSLTGLNMLEHVVRAVRGRPLRASEFSVLLNGVNDRTTPDPNVDADTVTRAEIGAAPFFSGALLPESVPYSGALRAAPSERIAVNPINVTAMMRVGGRNVKEALARSAAAILRRAQP